MSDQSIEALRRAQLHRRLRSAHKRQLAAIPYPDSPRTAAEVVVDPPAHMRSMTVGMLLEACRGVSQRKAAQLSRRACLNSARTIAGLTDPERAELAIRICAWADEVDARRPMGVAA